MMNLDVLDLLNKLRTSVINHNYDIVPTQKNRASRRKYGLSIFDIEDILLDLDIKDLVEGPVVDRDYPKEELFIFKKKILDDIIFYIKVKYKNNIIKILSFHIDELRKGVLWKIEIM